MACKLTPTVTRDATVCYSYDALGRRTEKNAGGVKTDYLYDLSGHPVTEFSSSCSMCWTVGYIYLSGGLVAQYSGGTTSFVHGDNLGSSRIVTSLTGGVTDCNAFYPYGEQDATICNSTSLTTHKFEGKERDTETLNDNFGARYYSSSLGRWLSADWSAIPAPVPYANLSNPQTLNLYAMVHDNPETFADLDGHEKCGPSCRGAVFDGGSGGWAGDFSPDSSGDNGKSGIASAGLAEQQQAVVAQAKADSAGVEPACICQGPDKPKSQDADDQQYHQALDQREREFRDKQAGPAPGTPEYIGTVSNKVSDEMHAGNKLIGTAAGIEAVGVAAIVALSPEAAAGAKLALGAALNNAQPVVEFADGVLNGASPTFSPVPSSPAGFTGYVVGKIVGFFGN